MLRPKDPAGALVKEREILNNIAGQIGKLHRDRAAALLGDDLAPVERIDADLERLRAASGRHQDRIAALQDEVRRQAADAREHRRAEAVKVIAAKLKQREAAAVALEQAVGETVRAYSTLVAADRELRSCWQGLPMPSYFATDQGVAGEILYALHLGSRRGGRAARAAPVRAPTRPRSSARMPR